MSKETKPMIIQTRYRDIPWEEARKCQSSFTEESEPFWNKVRGRPVLIQTPATEGHSLEVICGGPFYLRVPFDGRAGIVCPHIAEIGD